MWATLSQVLSWKSPHSHFDSDPGEINLLSKGPKDALQTFVWWVLLCFCAELAFLNNLAQYSHWFIKLTWIACRNMFLGLVLILVFLFLFYSYRYYGNAKKKTYHSTVSRQPQRAKCRRKGRVQLLVTKHRKVPPMCLLKGISLHMWNHQWIDRHGLRVTIVHLHTDRLLSQDVNRIGISLSLEQHWTWMLLLLNNKIRWTR